MASGDLSNQPLPFLAHFGNDCLGQNAGLVENRAAAMPLPQPEIIPRQWMPDERDAFISWLRGEFAAANAIIDAMCHHLRIIGEPGEYDIALACIQQRRYNWSVVLHLQQYFSVAEVVYALQQVTCRKQQARSTDLPHVQHARRILDHPKEIRTPATPGDSKREAFLLSGPGTSVPNAATTSNLSRGPKTASSRNTGNEDIPSGEAVQSRISGADVRFPEEERLSRSDLETAANELTDLDSSSSASLKYAELPAAHEPQTDSENECSSSVSNTQDSVIPPSKKNEVHRKGRDSNGSGSHTGRTKSLDARSPLCQHVYNISHPRILSDSFVGKLPNIDFNLPKEEDEARLSMIKVSKQFQCWEQAEGNMINLVDGLELYENVVSNVETSQLVNLVTELQAAGRRGELGGQTFVTDQKSAAGGLKETIQFGHMFSGLTEDSDSSGRSIEPMPAALQSLIDRLIHWHILPASRVLDCCSIDILEEGAYSPPRMRQTCLDRFFCSLSLMNECGLVLGRNISMEQHGDFKGPFNMVLPPGSVLILKGNSADVANQAILASMRKRIIITFAKVLVRKVSNVHPSTGKPTRTAPNAVATTKSWSPVGQQGLGVASGGGRGLVPTIIKHHNIGTTSGVLPMPSVRSASHVPQQIPQHLVTANLQTLFTNPSGAAGYPAVGVMGQGWSAVPRPSRLNSSGTGVFFPSSGSSGGPVRPMGAPQLQTGLIMLPPFSQRADSLVALTSSQASNFVYPSNRILRPSLSADQIDQFGDSTASFLSPSSLGSNDATTPRTLCKEPANGSTPKSEANGNRNTKDEHQQRVHRPKAGGAGKC